MRNYRSREASHLPDVGAARRSRGLPGEGVEWEGLAGELQIGFCYGWSEGYGGGMLEAVWLLEMSLS